MYSPITTVNITLQTAGITASGFGTPLFIADVDTDTSPDPLGAGVRVKTYSQLEDVAVDFDTSDAAYVAAQGFFSNTPRVPQIKIGYRDTGTAAETMTEALSEIRSADSDFYFVTAESHIEEDVLDLADAVEASVGFYFFSSEDEATLSVFDEGTSTDVLALVKEGNYERSKGLFHHDADSAFPECVFVGFNAPFLAGSVTWDLLQISLSASQDPATNSPLTDTQKGYLEDRDASYTERAYGEVIVLRNGESASGVSIDLIRGIDSLTEELNVAIAGLLLRQKGSKLPYTNEGISAIVTVVDQVFSRFASTPRNFLNVDYSITALSASKVSAAKKESRVYDDLTFTATAQGAIESIVINGTVSVAL